MNGLGSERLEFRPSVALPVLQVKCIQLNMQHVSEIGDANAFIALESVPQSSLLHSTSASPQSHLRIRRFDTFVGWTLPSMGSDRMRIVMSFGLRPESVAAPSRAQVALIRNKGFVA